MERRRFIQAAIGALGGLLGLGKGESAAAPIEESLEQLKRENPLMHVGPRYMRAVMDAGFDSERAWNFARFEVSDSPSGPWRAEGSDPPTMHASMITGGEYGKSPAEESLERNSVLEGLLRQEEVLGVAKTPVRTRAIARILDGPPEIRGTWPEKGDVAEEYAKIAKRYLP